jgi:hypothetical protein
MATAAARGLESGSRLRRVANPPDGDRWGCVWWQRTDAVVPNIVHLVNQISGDTLAVPIDGVPLEDIAAHLVTVAVDHWNMPSERFLKCDPAAADVTISADGARHATFAVRAQNPELDSMPDSGCDVCGTLTRIAVESTCDACQDEWVCCDRCLPNTDVGKCCGCVMLSNPKDCDADTIRAMRRRHLVEVAWAEDDCTDQRTCRRCRLGTCPRYSLHHLVVELGLDGFVAQQTADMDAWLWQALPGNIGRTSDGMQQLRWRPAQHSTVPHSTAQHSTAQHSTAQHSTA